MGHLSCVSWPVALYIALSILLCLQYLEDKDLSQEKETGCDNACPIIYDPYGPWHQTEETGLKGEAEIKDH